MQAVPHAVNKSKKMKANHSLCALAGAAIVLSRSVTGESFAQDRVVKAPHHATTAAAFSACSPDGEHFVVVTAEGRITYGRASDGATLRTFYHCQPQAVEFSPDGRMLATVGTSHGRMPSLKVWKVDEGTLLCRLKSGTLVRSNTTATGLERSPACPAHLLPLTGGKILAFTPDGQWLRAAGGDGETVAWELPSAAEPRGPDIRFLNGEQ